MFIQTYSGELAALLVAVFWTITALSFEMASKKVGSLPVNVIRLGFALIFLSLFSFFYRGHVLPDDASAHAWLWLSLSGLVGFVFGDYFLFHSYTLISSRIAMLVMTFVPPVTAFIGWLLLGEKMTPIQLLGMFLTVSGVGMTIMGRNRDTGKFSLHYPIKGLFFAFLGVLGQAGGLVLSKYGMQEYDPFASTQIRIIAGLAGFIIIVALGRNFSLVTGAFKNRNAMMGITSGSFFGPFLGVSFSLLAIKHTNTGIAATLMAIVPILIIPPAAWLFKQKISWIDIIGAIISVGGVVLFFI
jgi:drug/metabolite transporter (DMT)-like permease